VVNALSLPGEPDLKSPDAGRAVGPFDEKRAQAAIRELLIAIGEDPERDGLRDTPDRVARAYREMFAGLRQAPEEVLTTTFDLGHDEMVLVRDIELYSCCEHHLVPFHGVAHVISRVCRQRGFTVWQSAPNSPVQS